MKCPNCRCVIPQSMAYCGYCGYKLPDGSEKTLTVDKIYAGDMITPDNSYNEYDGYFCNNGSQNFSQDNDFSGYGSSSQNIGKADTLTEDMIYILIAGVCISALLIVLALLILML